MKIVGKRTYAASIGLVLAAVGGYLLNELTAGQMVISILGACGFAGLRAAK